MSEEEVDTYMEQLKCQGKILKKRNHNTEDRQGNYNKPTKKREKHERKIKQGRV